MPPKSHHPGRFIWMTITVISVSLVVLLLTQQPPAVGGLRPQLDEPTGSNIMAISVQLYPGSEAIALIDKDRQTLCLYQYRTDAQLHESFVLLAVRNFRYDLMLEDFNNAEPTPADIRKMIDKMVSPAEPAREQVQRIEN